MTNIKYRLHHVVYICHSYEYTLGKNQARTHRKIRPAFEPLISAIIHLQDGLS